MKAMKPSRIILWSLLTVTAPLCHAFTTGGSDGGGGDAVLCYSSEAVKNQVAQTIRERDGSSFENEADLKLNELTGRPAMLEVFETQGLQALSGNLQGSPFDPQGEASVLANIQTAMPAFMKVYRNFVSKNYQWQERRYGVVEIDDSSGVSRIPKSCILVQVAYFNDDTNTINYDSRIVQLMDSRNQLALKLHEDLYKMWRFNAQNNALELGKVANLSRQSPSDLETYEYFVRRFGVVQSSNQIRPLAAVLSAPGTLDPKAIKHYAKYTLVGIEVKTYFFGTVEIINKYTNEVLATRDTSARLGDDRAWVLQTK